LAAAAGTAEVAGIKFHHFGLAEAALLPAMIPCVLNFKDGNCNDRRQHDRSGQYRHQRKHLFSGAPVNLVTRAIHSHAMRFQPDAPFV
jgi:hypothetical protein